MILSVQMNRVQETGEFVVFSVVLWGWIKGRVFVVLSCVKEWRAQVTLAGWVRRREETVPLS